MEDRGYKEMATGEMSTVLILPRARLPSSTIFAATEAGVTYHVRQPWSG